MKACENRIMWMDVKSLFLLVVYCSHPLLGCRLQAQTTEEQHSTACICSPPSTAGSGRGPKHCPQQQGSLLLLGARGTAKMCLGVEMK